MTPKEAVFAFAAWLSTREEPVTISASHDSAIVAQLVGAFCEANGLAEGSWGDVAWVRPVETGNAI